MNLKITVLGCGNSTGVPAIGNYWGKCDPNEPKNRRTRSSILVESATTKLVIDTGPDFRNQLNNTNAETIDAVLYTHAHSDHVQGIDELRMIKHRGDGNLVPIYGNRDTMSELKTRFDYMFSGGNLDVYPPIVASHVFQDADFGVPHKIGDIEFVPFEQDHGSCMSVGYRFGDFAYSVDMLTLEEGAVNTLKGVETWLVDCAGYGQQENPVHANLETIQRLNKEIGARDIYLTSLTLSSDYQAMQSELPKGYTPAYDGLVIHGARPQTD